MEYKTYLQDGKKRHRAKAKAQKDTVSVAAEWLANRPSLTELTLTTLTVLFGVQILRALGPSMFWILSERMGWNTIALGAVGCVIVLISFLPGTLSQLLGNRRLVVATAGGVGLVRLFMQFWWEEPLFNLSLAIIGTILFITFLPARFENTRLQGISDIQHFAVGLLGGLVLDTAINGAFGTYDTIWQVKPLPALLTLLLVAIQLAFLVGISLAKGTSLKATSRSICISNARSLTWAAIGPFLFFELVILQNIPRLATLTNWLLPVAFGVILVAQLAGLAAAIWFLSKKWQRLWPWALGCGIILTGIMIPNFQKIAALTVLQFLVGQVLVSVLLAMVLMGIATGSRKTQRISLSIANGVGILLLLMSVFAYYAVYKTSLPYKNTLLEPIAGGMITACALGATVIREREVKANLKLWAVPMLALPLLLLPIGMTITCRAPTVVTGDGLPIRVMTYNVHSGFNPKGKLDIEAIAQVIEKNNPDVVALQEVSRGWLINGRLDMLGWLSQRLRMSHVFGATADIFWGNAILSRYPIMAYSRHDLPPKGLPIPCGFMVALIDLGKNEKLKVINTQFHHIKNDSDIRQLQSKAILDFLAGIGSNRTVMLGNLNAGPKDLELRMLLQARILVDAAERMNPRLTYTFPSDNPHQRLDYILTSPDLIAEDIRVPASIVSTHLPVVAVISK